MLVLVTGGAKSGKSSFAEKYAAAQAASGVYVATSQIFDEEMRVKIQRHQEDRQQSGYAWRTIEEPYELVGLINRLQLELNRSSNEQVILVDCLTLWLSNWILAYPLEEAAAAVSHKIAELVSVLECVQGNVILVTNEVGYGIVPDNALARLFRDLAGMMNQQIAAISQRVYLVTAGIPLELKSLQINQ